MLVWRLDALAAVAVAVFAWGAAWFLWTGAAASTRERRAALLVALMGTALLADPGLVLLAGSAPAAFAGGYVRGVLLVVLPLAQLALVRELPGRGVAALRTWPALFVGLVLTLLGLIVALARPDWVVARVQDSLAFDGWVAVPGIVTKVALAAWLVTLAFGALVAALATSPRADKEQADAMRSWLAAYVALSIGESLSLFLFLWALGDPMASTSGWFVTFAHVFAALPLALFTVFVLQAVARERSSGARRRARRFVSGTTVVAIFTFPIVLGGELLERLFNVTDVVGAMLVAVMLAVALRPIQWLADRVARRVVNEPAGRKSGAAELYRAAIEGAFGDGEINPKEQRTLDRLSDQLGLSPAEAKRIEAETLGRLRSR